MADYAGAKWIGPAYPDNYMVGRQGNKVTGLVLHHTASTLQGAIATFTMSSGKSGGGTSAHFIVDRDGTRYQVVDTADTAFSDGIFTVNLTTISIEHVRLWGDGPGTAGYEPITDAQYASSHELCAILAADNGFLLSADTVKPHRFYVPDVCPGDLDVERVIQGGDMTPEEHQMLVDIHGSFGTAAGQTIGSILAAIKTELDALSAHSDPAVADAVARIEAALKQA